MNLWVGPWVEGSASTLDLSASAKRLMQQLVFFQNQDFKKGSRDPYRISFFRLLFRFLGHILSMFNILHYKPYHPLFIVILILISQQQLVLQEGQVIDLPICLQLLHILRSKWPGWDWWSTGTHPKTVCSLYMKSTIGFNTSYLRNKYNRAFFKNWMGACHSIMQRFL